MAVHEASHGDEYIEATKHAVNLSSRPLGKLPSHGELSRRSKSSLPVAAERHTGPRPQRCHSRSPLANSTPLLATQRSMITMSNDSFRSPSALDDIPENLLRRYPRFSTATTSIDTGRPNFSIEELKSTQLSDDEDDIINDEPRQHATESRALLKHRVAKDVKAMWSSRTRRIRYARERLKTWSHKPTLQPVDQQLHPTETVRSHTSTAVPGEAHDLPAPTSISDNVSSSPEPDESESTSATATASTSANEEIIDQDRSELGNRVATMIREDIREDHQASSQRPSLRYAASAIQMSSPQVAEDRLLLGRQSFLAPLRSNPRTQSMATLETIRASAFGQGQYQHRSSLSNMSRTSQPPSRPSTMRGRQSFSSSVNPQKAETLFIDTPDDPGTSFVFPSSKAEKNLSDREGSRPVSHAGSIFSGRTATDCSANEPYPQVEFGRALPHGYQKVPAYTIRRIERKDAYCMDLMSLPTLPDSPIAFGMNSDTRDGDRGIQQPQENVSRASKWSTKVQTTVKELQEQEALVEDPPEETKKENFAVRSYQKIVRVLSTRIVGRQTAKEIKVTQLGS